MSEGHSTVEYREVARFPGYRFGSDGSVWSCWAQRSVGKPGGFVRFQGAAWKQLKPQPRRDGRLSVRLPGETVLIHRMILEAFVGPCPPNRECRHLDNDCTNNSIGNLCWGTKIENEADKLRFGTLTLGERNGMAKLSEADVAEVRQLAKTTHKKVIAAKFGISVSNVYKILEGKSRREK